MTRIGAAKEFGSRLAWLAPAIAFLALFMVLPLFDVVRLSFTTASIIEPEYSYTLSSYAKVFGDKDFLWSLSITFIFVAANCALQIPLGLLIALAVHAGRDRNVYGSILARTAILTAWIIPGVLVGILWKTLLSSASSGIINHFIQSLGMERIPFLLDPLYAVISIIGANVWGGAAFCMILQYAGLQRIPAELYEVSRVDGARAWQQFLHITLPQLKPILFINLVLITISSFNTFDMIATLTSGGPAGTTEVLTLAAYIQVFTYWNMGRGSAIAVLLLTITVVMTVVYYKLFQLDEDIAE
ncbi:MAG: sugar ABC transporter permease [Spirochaetaceae bacterium]|nr:sugar ABC transporter permease [Spirochaetaceae bacterium]